MRRTFFGCGGVGFGPNLFGSRLKRFFSQYPMTTTSDLTYFQNFSDIISHKTSRVCVLKRTNSNRTCKCFHQNGRRSLFAEVLQPFGEPFTARLVDDFVWNSSTSCFASLDGRGPLCGQDAEMLRAEVHNAERCFNAEVNAGFPQP